MLAPNWQSRLATPATKPLRSGQSMRRTAVFRIPRHKVAPVRVRSLPGELRRTPARTPAWQRERPLHDLRRSTLERMDRIGRYKIVRELGRGAMGVVYHAIDPNIGRPVAIKTINLGAVPKAEDQERMRERLFYVAMTRAEDTLAIYAKQGKGTDTRPTKFLREFMGASAHSKFWRPLQAAAV